MNKVVIGIVVSILLASLFGWQYVAIQSLERQLGLANQKVDQLKENRDELAAALADSEASKHALMKELQQQQTVLAQRDAAIVHSRKKLAVLSEKLRGLRNTDEAYTTWSGARVPDSVIRLLRNLRAPSDRQN